jgi:polyphosphate kinase
MLLEDVLRHYLPRLYHGFELLSTHAIRVTRDADFGISRRQFQFLHQLHHDFFCKLGIVLQTNRVPHAAFPNTLLDAHQQGLVAPPAKRG